MRRKGNRKNSMRWKRKNRRRMWWRKWQNCSHMGPLSRVQSSSNRLLQHGSPRTTGPDKRS